MKAIIWGGAAVIAAGAAAWLVVAVMHHQECAGLEEDFLNTMSSARQGIALETFSTGNAELSEAADKLKKLNDRQMELTLTALAERCGKRATDTAMRKAAEAIGV